MVTAPTPPAPLPRPALDSHTHLDMIDTPVPEVLAAARAAGLTRVVTVGCDLPSSRWSARCATEYDAVYAAVAIHPNETANPAAAGSAGEPRGGTSREAVLAEAVLAEIEALARQPRVVAVGETGLDYYRNHAAPDVQRWWFREHIAIAKRTGKALMIHDRDAHADVLGLLEAEGPPPRVVFHCFSGDAAMAQRCAEAGYVMSFAGNVTFANAQPLRDAAVAAPPDLILVETDAPYLTPVPNRGRPNSPAMVAYTLRYLADLKGIDVPDLCDAVTATAERTFGPFSPW
jgi:TatD DNase family protein